MRTFVKFQAIQTLLLVILFFMMNERGVAQYNNLWIPDTLSGTTFNLNIKDTFSQIRPGQQTNTAGINNKFWGPTLFINKGDTVHMNVRNSLNDSTTLHWHGMHLPAVMDGGPHQVIPPGTLWQPYWKVANNAATYWYHPHLHEMTQEQITKGIGGLIIVRDAVESALPLPRKYGVDDIPLVLTDRDFTTANQFSVVPYGDSSMVNGVLSPQCDIPSQVVRFRILNAAIERSYNLGFSDNRTFYVITSDGGLLNAPVPLTRYLLHAGERIEILVNCIAQSGTSFNLKAYNSTLSQQVPGGDLFPNGPFANALARIDFNVLHLNVGTQTSNPITAIPTTLTTVNTIPAANANTTRFLTITDTTVAGTPGATFIINHRLFNINYNDYTVPLDNTEIWEINNSGNFGHPFHIHDVEFNILSVNGAVPEAAQAGWKDVVFVPSHTIVKFIAKFDDYADNTHPFMYHCHISLHEDEGMMGQFVVGSTAVSPTVSTLSCAAAIFSATSTVNTIYSGTANLPYTGGNGIAYTTGTAISSTGVSGLAATLQSGTLASGSGNLSFVISGTPTSSGTANFAISFGGQSCTLSLTVNAAPTPSANRNVILIIADDMGTDYLGFYENHQDTVDVPNLRYLVNHGVRFTNATSDPVCSATRATIITGRYGFRTGVGAIIGGTGGSGVLDTTEITIPKLLRGFNQNLTKAHIGKWHLQQPTPVNLTAPNRMGYDRFEGPFIGTLTPGYTNWTKITDGVSSTVTTYATTEQTNNACSWIRNNVTKPFYVCLAYNAPHDPLHLPPAGLHTYTGLSGTQADINNNPKSYYKAMIQAMDHEMGRLFDSLRAINKFDSTDFIFIGDNGSIARVAQIADTSRAKGTLYEYGIHVPMIISGPSVVNPGRVSDALVNAADIFATVLELYGYSNWSSQIPANKTVDSKSLLPVIKNQSTSVRPWAFAEIFKTTTDSSDGKAMRNKDYKLIRFDDGRERFYNLSIDPSELTNLLVGNMTSTDNTNYAYLCNQMRNLVNAGNSCPAIANPIVTALNCNTASVSSANVYLNTPFNAILTLPYTGGNELAYLQGTAISSTGVIGLTVTIQSGTLNNGNGNLTLIISGTPTSTGTAVFSITFGGQTCSFSLPVNSLSSYAPFGFKIGPSPATDHLKVILNTGSEAYYIWIYDAIGRTVRMLPQPDLTNGIDISNLSKGVYMIKVMNASNKQVLTKKFVKG